MNNDFLNADELIKLGLAYCGENVRISKHALLFNPSWIKLRSNSRVDAFAVLSASQYGIELGDYSHIASGVKLYGTGGRIQLGKFTGVSANSVLYTANDSWNGDALMHPTVPEEYRGIKRGNITLHQFSAVGANCVLLPGVTLGEGAAVGAGTVLKSSIYSACIVAGNPNRVIRSRDLANLKRLGDELCQSSMS